MELMTAAVPTDPLWMNAVRFLVMLMGGVVLGVLFRWAQRERRRAYMGVGAGITLLVVEAIIVHYARIGEPINWQLPINAVAFTLLIVSLWAIRRENIRTANRNRRVH